MDEFINQVPEEYREIYRNHWSTIRQRVIKGVFKDVYHYPLAAANNSEIVNRLQATLSEYADKIKINVCFGFILRKKGTDQLKFFHPSNNTMMFQFPRMLQTSTDYNQFAGDIEQEDILEYVVKQRPSTHWTVERIICVRFDIFRLSPR